MRSKHALPAAFAVRHQTFQVVQNMWRRGGDAIDRVEDLPTSDRAGIKDPNDPGKYLQLQFTIEDEGVFTTPWTATMTYVRDPDGWPEMVCAENMQWYSGKNAEVPRAAKPDF